MGKMNEVWHRAFEPMKRILGHRKRKDQYEPGLTPTPPLITLNRIVTIMVRRPGRIKEYRVLTRQMNAHRVSFFTRTDLKVDERLKCSLLLNRGITIEFDARVSEVKIQEDLITGQLELEMEPQDFNHLVGFLAQVS